jgi:hypothetical protein
MDVKVTGDAAAAFVFGCFTTCSDDGELELILRSRR